MDERDNVWRNLYKQAKVALLEGPEKRSKQEWNALIDSFANEISQAEREIRFYSDALSQANTSKPIDYFNGENSCTPSHLAANIKTTRWALSFVRFCLQPPWNDFCPGALHRFQCQVVSCELFAALARILAADEPFADTKFASEASKILCNTVTSNNHTSSSAIDSLTGNGISWFRIISACSKSMARRDSLGRVAATLYNIIVALENVPDNSTSLNSELHSETFVRFAHQLAGDDKLMCSLVRNILPKYVETQKKPQFQQEPDETTQWVSLLIWKLAFEMSHLQTIDAALERDSDQVNCLLYQALLNHLMLDDGHDIYDHIKEPECLFLAKKAADLSLTQVEDSADDVTTFVFFNNPCTEDERQICRLVMKRCCYEILYMRLTLIKDREISTHRNDCDECDLRNLLCQESNIISDLVHTMSLVTCRVLEYNASKRSRDMTISHTDQVWIKLSIQLIGSLCYRSKKCQDALRNVQVNYPGQDSKNGLHVLLETTSLSPCCFGIREWTIVAIRYALSNNRDNQELLEKLSPQEAILTPELSSLGIKALSIDQSGKVRVSQGD